MKNNKITLTTGNDPVYELHFNELVQAVFGFDFGHWFRLGVWDDCYESYGLWLDGRLVAHSGLFKMNLLVKGAIYPTIQFSAVAVHPDFRGKGLMKILFEHIFAKYPDTSALLFANESVLDFYPRFGFKPTDDYIACSAQNINNEPASPVTPEQCRKIVENCRPHSQILDCANGHSIRLFHLFGEFAEKLYRIDEVVIAAEVVGETLKIADIFSRNPVKWNDLKKRLPFRNIRKVEFGFCPDFLEVEYQWCQPAKCHHFFTKNMQFLPEKFAVSEFIRT